MNLFLTEDGMLKLGYYGITTQAECYSIRKTDCDGIRSFAPEVFEGEYEMKSDVWSLGTALLELMGIVPYARYNKSRLPTKEGYCFIPFDVDGIKSSELAYFLEKFFEEEERLGVIELINVSVI